MASTAIVTGSSHGIGRVVAMRLAHEGVEELVRVLPSELCGHNITVNGVAPGPVATELFLHGTTPAQIEQFSKISPLERLGLPEDIANVVSFLAGPDGGWVNSQVLCANGGFA